MKTYKGKRLGPKETLPEVNVVVIEKGTEKPLQHRIRHSPTGLEWGYSGSGPADLALSILWDHLGKEPKRIDYMRFKDNFVSGWGNEWEIDSETIGGWLEFEDEAEFAGA